MKTLKLIPFFLLLTFAAFAQVNLGIYPLATASGTDEYTATVSPGPQEYKEGQRFNIKFTNANTGSSTLNINDLGAVLLTKSGGTALEEGDIAEGEIKLIVYDGTNMQIVGAGGGQTYTFDNGLTESDGAVELGGELVPGETFIYGTTSTLRLGENNSTTYLGTFSVNASNISLRRRQTNNYLSVTDTRISMTSETTGHLVGLYSDNPVSSQSGARVILHNSTNGDSIQLSVKTSTPGLPLVKMMFHQDSINIIARSDDGINGIRFSSTKKPFVINTVTSSDPDRTIADKAYTDTKLPKSSTASDGTDVAFDIPRTYGYDSDATGNITFTTTGLVEGITQLMIHNDSSEPTFESGMVVISGEYVPNVDNYILMHAVKSDLILVTISQEQ